MNTPLKEQNEEDPWTTFRDFLSSRGLRITNQRHAIFKAAYDYEQHFTAEELLDRARAIDHTVSRATIYRTLPILVESGLIREVDIGKDYKYYMAQRSADNFKAQVICLDDDQIFEIDAPFMEWYGKAVAAKLGLEVVSQRLQVQARHPIPGATANPSPKSPANTSKQPPAQPQPA